MRKIQSLLGPGAIDSSYADAGDFLRAACVGFIGWYHIWQQSWLNPDLHIGGHWLRFYPLVACGYMFVDLMLLLSGFLLMLGWLNGRGRNARSFYTARAARILPSYLLCIAVMLVFALAGGLYGSTRHFSIDLFTHLSFTHNLFDESYRFTHLNGALWTLAVEVQFYLIFPLLARAFERHPQRVYGAMVLLGLLARTAAALLATDVSFYMNRLSCMMDVYANGMLAAWIFRELSKRPQKTWQAWLSTALAIGSAVLIYRILNHQLSLRGSGTQYSGQLLLRFPLSAMGCVFLVCGSRSILALRRLFSNRLIRFLSGVSFNFYIWHQFLAVKLKQWRIPFYEGENPNMAGLVPWQRQYTLCCFAAALACAIIVTYFVEKPCARRIKRALSIKDS